MHGGISTLLAEEIFVAVTVLLNKIIKCGIGFVVLVASFRPSALLPLSARQ